MEVSIECDSTCLVLSAVTSIDSALFKPAKTRPVALSSLYETAPDGSDRVRLLENDSVDFYIDAGATGDLVTVERVLEDNTPNVWLLNAVPGELRQMTFGTEYTDSQAADNGAIYQDVNRRRNADPVDEYYPILSGLFRLMGNHSRTE